MIQIDIVIARAIRNFEGGISELTLSWSVSHSKLKIECLTVKNGVDAKRSVLPDHGVRGWLDLFTRDQTRLEPVQYHISMNPSSRWKTILDFQGSL